MSIYFQGLKGAFSEAVATRLKDALFLSNPARQCELIPASSFHDVTMACSRMKAVLGVLPVSNTLGGPVDPALAALAANRPRVIGEHLLFAKHHLWAREGVRLEDVNTVASHPQALVQCKKMLEKHNFKSIETTNTAVAASRLASEDVPFEAAISSERAGHLYGLQRLLANVQDSEDNTTTFLLLGELPVDWSLELQEVLRVEPSVSLTIEKATSSADDIAWIAGEDFLLKKDDRADDFRSSAKPLNPQKWMVL
ncbi:MAG: hypothetical protein GY822_18730 [Deltaproteobacteria bacterium]|nr:hypothetical protein [Deltaproteobacteria bacterium]